MKGRYAQLIAQIAALTGFAMSAWLVVQYSLPATMTACGPGGGCHAVRDCHLSSILGVSWPVIGTVAFGAFLAMTLTSHEGARRLLPLAGGLSIVTGIALIVLQRVVCHAFCKYCIVADISGIVGGAAAILSRHEMPDAWRGRKIAFGLLAAGSLFGAFAWGATRRPPPPAPTRLAQLPEAVAREQRPGVATIVEFFDFECPHCRRQHAVMHDVLPTYGTRVRFVRRHLPLTTIHPNAIHAARAACCAEEQGRLEAIANELFRAEDLSADGCARIAERIGLDMAAYRECVPSPRIASRLDHDRDDGTSVGVEAVPTLFIGAERFEGVLDEATFRASIDRAIQRSTAPPPPAGPRG